MGDPILVTGVILSVMPIGEYDKRVLILTKERGKITAFARGARRPNSTLLAAANAFVFGTFTLYEGRNSYTLIQANVIHHFRELAMEQPGVYYGFYFLEFADYYGRENVDETDMVNLIYVALRAICNHQLPNTLVRAVYEIKALTVNGEYAVDDMEKLNPATQYALQYIVSSPMEKLYTFTLKPEILRELMTVARKQVRRQIDKKFRSLEILETIDEV
ncbi:MAG: DNA repair protein RecO [Lachnospiraceae bacterium]|nr:DNA repair protein RecO [Lachnospiraceae bacterium]